MSPRVILHPNPDQPGSCLESLLQYAQEISRTAMARSFSSLAGVADWIRMQDVKLDEGEAPQRPGCSPTQRGRIWPLDGMNCWEATAHFVGVAQALGVPEVLHVYDVTRGGHRHVWPEVQDALQLRNPVPFVLQRPVGSSSPRAQAEWYNTVADVAHGVGGAVLTAFGAEGLKPVVDSLWGLAPAEYGLSKNRPPEAPTAPTPPTPPDPTASAAPFGGVPNPFTGNAPQSMPQAPYGYAPAPYGYPPAPYGYPVPYAVPVAFSGAPNPFSAAPPPAAAKGGTDLLSSLRSLMSSSEGESLSSNNSLRALINQFAA